ncbi:MAG: hypothetical protein OXF73_11475 [Gammaproteobacteria bacterium]|nr:hypothetical protein [Gammaproteobacteria bacterium]
MQNKAKMAPSAQLSVKPTGPTVLSIGLPDHFNAALCQKEYSRYSIVFSSVSWDAPIDSASFKIRLVDPPSPDIDRQVYEKRLKKLKEAAEEEGIVPIATSLDAFFKFIDTAPFKIRRAALFLSDDGAYAAIWRNEIWRLNIKFLGGDIVEYVLLGRNVNSPEGVVGSATFKDFNNLITGKDLKPLLKA